MSNLPAPIRNPYRATRPRHMLGNNPRKLVSQYQARDTAPINWLAVAIVAVAAFALAFLILS